MDIKRPQSKQPMPEHAKKVFKGIMFDTYQWEQEMYDGSKKVFEKIKRPDTVSVFPVLPNGKILLTEQEQPGRDLYIGAPGGRVDENEDPLFAAKRELLEETGCEAEEFILWQAKHPTTKIDWVVYTFIAKGLKKIKSLELDGGEKIKIIERTLDEIISIVTDKKIYFADEEISIKLLEAKYDQKKKEELRELFNPNK